jgi:hypothetical protein
MTSMVLLASQREARDLASNWEGKGEIMGTNYDLCSLLNTTPKSVSLEGHNRENLSLLVSRL